MSTFKPALLRALVSAGLFHVASVDALAQRQPTAFVHGFRSDPSTWTTTANRLAQDLAISATRPALSPHTPYAQQATQLSGLLAGFPDTTIAVGHSNGGIVSRTAAQGGRKFKGIITAASLHAGAPLAANVLDSDVFLWGHQTAAAIVEPLWVYGQWWFADPIATDRRLLFYLWSPFALMYDLLTGLEDGLAFAGLPSYLAQPVLANMSSAPLFAQLNGAGMAAEAANSGRAVGIAYTVPYDFGAMWWALAPAKHTALTSLQFAAAFGLLLVGEEYMNYQNNTDPFEREKRNQAYLWFNAAAALLDMDAGWCGLIGAGDPNYVCAPHDGVLPTAGHAYPRPGAIQRFGGFLAHGQVTEDDGSRAQIEVSLADDFAVPRCATAPFATLVINPPPTLIIGTQYQLTVSAINICGQSVAAPVVTWASLTPAVATVSGTGVVSGVAVGVATIRVTGGGRTAEVQVTIGPLP